MYYWRPDPLLVLTDSLDVGNTTSESAHTYTAIGSMQTGDKTYKYQGDCNAWGADMMQNSVATQSLVTDNGRIINGSSEFTAAILPDNNGVRILRRMDASTIQMAKVFVDNKEVTESRFYTPINFRPGDGFYRIWNGIIWSQHLFRDIEFDIPAAYTKGKSSIRIRMENMRPTANGGDWSEFLYHVYSYRSGTMPTQ